MWQQLVNDIGIVWIIMVLLLTTGIAVLSFLIYASLTGMTASLLERVRGLRQDIMALPPCRVENIQQTQIILGERGGPDFKVAIDQMVEDSQTHYEGHWTPDPAERFDWRMLLNERSNWLMQPSTLTLPVLGGVIVTFLAFVVALSISPDSFYNIWMRTLALLPLLVSGLALLFLMQGKKQLLDRLLAEWQAFMVQLKRKLPVYDQAAETASLLKTFTHYDQQMTQAAKQLSDRVDALASHQLTESINSAVKYTMAATVAPPIQKSTDALNVLAYQLEKKLTAGENQIIRLYNDLEKHQEQQAELWMRRHQEVSQTLTHQQKQVMQQLVTASQENWQTLNKQLSELMKRVSSGQQELQENLLSDQQQSLLAIRQANQDVVGQMQTQYTTTLHEQSSTQTQTLKSLADHQIESLQAIETRIGTTLHHLDSGQTETLLEMTGHFTQTLGTLKSQIASSLETLSISQIETLHHLREEMTSSLNALDSRVVVSLSDISGTQKAVLNAIRENQVLALHEISEHQEMALQAMNEKQSEMLETISSKQSQTLETISSSQSQTLEKISSSQSQSLQTISDKQAEALDHFVGRQVTALDAMRQNQQSLLEQVGGCLDDSLKQIEKTQAEALTLLRRTQQEAIEVLGRKQDEGARDLLDHFSDQIGSILGQYLDPVSTELQSSAQALIEAQKKNKDVQEQIAVQYELARQVEESIRDVLAQFVETRQTILGDLGAMEQSTRSMSDSAATMSAVYAGSQTGLTDAINQMSGEMTALSDSLTDILKGTAVQTQQMQEQANETYEINQQQLDAVKTQIDILTNDLSIRIDQLMLGFSQLTEDLIGNVRSTIDDQNNQLGGGLKILTETMSEEARSISLYAQQINMDINQLNGTLGAAVTQFSEGIQLELSGVLSRFDDVTADILRRLSVAASELGDAVENLPDVIRTGKNKEEKDKNNDD